MNKKEKFFSVDAKTLLSLGRNSIKDNTTALLELVKNSYDADASRVEIEIFCNSSEKYIRVADNGKGMTEEELDSRWLRIGHSTKGLEKITGSKRRKTGEKGIGRISADRLGAELELKTRSEDNETIGLKTDWNKFDVEGCNLDEIPSTLITNPQIQIPGNGKTGTELIITSLRQQWTADDIAILYEELSVLMPPFKQINNFEIFLNTDVSKEHKGKIISDLELAADTEITATYTDDKVNYVLRNADQIRNDKPGEKEQIDLKKLVHLATSSNLLQGKPSKLRCGPAEVRILFYLRAASGLGESGFSLKKLRDYLNKFAGVKIYRDGIYVKPYGNPADPEGDWLSLAERKTREPAGVSRETYRVGGNQIIGAVLISRDKNPNLVDSAAREGFIKGQAFNDLRILVLGCLRLLESYRHRQKISEETKKTEKENILLKVKSLNSELTTLKQSFQSISSNLPDIAKQPLKRALADADKTTKDLESSVSELINENKIYRGLATIGIAAAVFGHETQTSISAVSAAVSAIKAVTESIRPNIGILKRELSKAEKYASQVSAWGAFALTRIQRDKRTSKQTNVKNLIDEILDFLKPVYEAINITIQRKINTVEGKVFPIDIEAIILNLLTNAYTFCQQEQRTRNIRVELNAKGENNRKGFEIIVADSGPGVSSKLAHRVWEPLYSTRTDEQGKEIGTGLGLSIVKSIVDELNGEKSVEYDSDLKGAKFVIWLPLEK